MKAIIQQKITFEGVTMNLRKKTTVTALILSLFSCLLIPPLKAMEKKNGFYCAKAVLRALQNFTK